MKRVLAICDDAWHPGETVRRGLASLPDNPRFQFEFQVDNHPGPEILGEYAVVILAKANMLSATDRRPWLTPDWVASFRDHLRRGSGLVVIHAGISRYELAPGMPDILGGIFARHPEPCAVTMEPQSGHLLTDGVEAFTVHDEHYFMTMHDKEAAVFLHSLSQHGRQPAGWTRNELGGGRVCVLTPGHGLEVWLHPKFQKLILNALRWAAKLN